jgi:hypothetical protein
MLCICYSTISLASIVTHTPLRLSSSCQHTRMGYIVSVILGENM